MPSTTTTSILTFFTLALITHAKTDLSGCTSSKTVAYGGASILWYVPGTGEICEALDCGGGRAPPKTTVPGCAAYSGTGTYSPSYIAIATDSAEGSYATSIGSWTSVASAWSSATDKIVTSPTMVGASMSGTGTLSSLSVLPSTTAKATLTSVAGVAAVGTGTAAGGVIIDTSVIGNGTALSTSSRTPTTAATASGPSESSLASGSAGVVRFGREAIAMIGGAIVGVALF